MATELPTVVVDDEDRILRANEAATRLLGAASTESIAGSKLGDFPLGASVLLVRKEATSKLAHEFNNLLSGILGTIGLAKLDSHDHARLLKRLDDAEAAVRRATALTARLRGIAKSPSEPTPRAARVLVVDDDDLLSGVVEAMLDQLGYRATTVRSGEEAITAYRRAMVEGDEYSAVLVDLLLRGGMGGRETVAQLRQIDGRVRTVASSGDVEDPVMRTPPAHGFDRSLPKPFSIDELQGVLRSVTSSG
jgi:CheY-like chemotaxis protein